MQKSLQHRFYDYQSEKLQSFIIYHILMALTQQKAEKRFCFIQQGSISYKFHLSFIEGQTFTGMSSITFSLKQSTHQLFLDCPTEDIKILLINGNKIDDELLKTMVKDNKFLYMRQQDLTVGMNSVDVIYRSKYYGDGLGLSSFVDVDQRQYIYSVFEPYLANRVFALFDQPDLKARMELTVISPNDWIVQSNELHKQQLPFSQKNYLDNASGSQCIEQYFALAQNQTQQTKIFFFPQTQVLPTYLYALIAGPYAVIHLENTYKDIPMRLFCLQSYLPCLQKWKPQIQEITNECLKFYQQFFGTPYTFNKLDQVFVHEFEHRGMENAGLLIYSDTYISNPDISQEQFLDFAATITHEIAHQWFGNLTTMKWWDDLWLNQSFAIFISYFVLHKIQDRLKTFSFQSSMAQYFGYKTWAYGEDQAITTHPVKCKVANTSVAQSIFDGITYCKGGSIIKQLIFLAGEENFSKALAKYFKNYAYKNATLEDLLAIVSEFLAVPNLNIEEWKQKWLLTCSLNTLLPQWSSKLEGKDRILQIHQGFYTMQYPILRTNKIKVALFKADCSCDVIQVHVLPEKVTQVVVNRPQESDYKAILLNYEDHAYAKIRIDSESLSFFAQNLTKIDDILTRTLIWYSFYEMVEDGQISSCQFVDLFTRNVQKQSSDRNLQMGFEKVFKCITAFTPIKYRNELLTRIFYFTLELLQKIDPSQENRSLILKQNLVKFASCDISISILLQWMQKRYEPLAKHDKISQKMKWQIIQVVCTANFLTKQKKLSIVKDNMSENVSEDEKINLQICEILLADDEKFKQVYEELKQGEKSSIYKKNISKGWNHNYHGLKLKEYKQKYFADILEVVYSLSRDHAVGFIENLQPLDDDLKETIEMYNNIKIVGDEFEKSRGLIKAIINETSKRIKAYVQHWQVIE